jgi:Uma2 family endonuclease
MALEVVSDTSERKDLVEHVGDYATAGVREYWIADARGDEVIFRILALGADAVYREVVKDASGWLASPLWGCRFQLRRFVDRAGMTDFTLDIDR